MMDDCIIEGTDTIITNEEIVNNWDAKASRKIITKLSVCENEKVLDDVLRDYIWVLQKHALHFKMKKLLKEKIIAHMKVFHLCCITISNLPTELQSYWENMENILVILCNLELDVVRYLKLDNINDYKEKILQLTTKLIYLLSVFLLNNNTRICHVLLKFKVRYDSRAWKDVMKVIYRHFLVMVPVTDKSEENFCRNYLLFRNYKSLVHKENHVKMDSVLFERFNMDRDLINKSRTLKKILLWSTDSIVDLVDNMMNCRQTAVDKYFKHIDKKTKDDDYIPLSINLESDSEDDMQSSMRKGNNDCDIEEIKIEDVVEETTTYYGSSHIICVDDDSDVEEIFLPIVSRSITKTLTVERTGTYISFLDSIDISGELLEESNPLIAEESSSITETLSSPDNSVSSAPLPFLELYLDNLKSKGQVLSTSGSNKFDSITVDKSPESAPNNTQYFVSEEMLTINCSLPSPVQEQLVSESKKTDSSNVNNNNQSQYLVSEERLATKNSLPSPVQEQLMSGSNKFDSSNVNNNEQSQYLVSEERLATNNSLQQQCTSGSKKIDSSKVDNFFDLVSNNNNQSQNLVSEDRLGTDDLLLSPVQEQPAEVFQVIEEPNVEVRQMESITSEMESSRTSEKSVGSLTNTDDFNFISGLITPPKSDRTADDVAADLNHMITMDDISFHQFMEISNNCVTISHSPSSNELGIESCIGGNRVLYPPLPVATDIVEQEEVHVTEENIEDNTECQVINTSFSTESQENVLTPNEEVEMDESLGIQGDPELDQINTPEAEEPVITSQVEKIHVNADIETSPSRVSNTENVITSSELLELDNSLHIQCDSELHQISSPDSEEPRVTAQVEKLCSNTDIEPNQPQRVSDTETVITPKSLDIQGLGQISTPSTEDQVITAQIEKLHINVDIEPNTSVRVSETENASASLETTLPMDTLLDKSQPVPSEIELTIVSPGCIGIEIEETQCESISETEGPLVISENLTPEDMILDESLLSSEITETVLNSSAVSAQKSPSFGENFHVNVAEKNVKKVKISSNVGLDEIFKTTEGSRNTCKIQASVSMSEIINGMNIKILPKFNDCHISNVPKRKPSTEAYTSEKVLYTSTERVSAPLSVFSQFEQTQSKLAEKAFSGPIEQIYYYSDTHSDHSNSNDSVHSFPYLRPQSQVKRVGLSKADSPISPAYEQIQAQDYENHILSVHYDHLINTSNSPLSHSKTTESKSNLENTQTEIVSGRKRKLDLGTNRNKKSKVNFGPTEVRIIPPRENPKFIEDDVLQEAMESMKEYKIDANDVKLVYRQPQIPIKIRSVSELRLEEKQLKIRDLLNNPKPVVVPNGKSCIFARIDYKKMESQMDHPVNSSPRNFGHNISDLIGNQPIESVPSGYIPPIDSYSSGFRYNYERTVSSTSTDVNCQSDAQPKVVGKANKRGGVRTVPKRPRGRPKRLDANYTFSTKDTS